MHRFFIPQLYNEEMSITGVDAKHIGKVLRMQPGDKLQIVSDDGVSALAEVASITESTVTVRCLEKLAESHEPAVKITLAQGLAKGEKMDFIIQKAVELGAYSIVPVAMGSNTELHNVDNLLNDIVELFPSPDKRPCNGINMKTNEIFAANYDFSKAKSAYVFKTIVDPFIGKYSLIKVSSGVIKSDDTLYNVDKETEEKLSKLYILRGNKYDLH